MENGIAESRQRREMEVKRQASRSHLAWGLLVFIFLFSILIFGLTAFSIIRGHTFLGGVLGTTGVFTFLMSIEPIKKTTIYSHAKRTP